MLGTQDRIGIGPMNGSWVVYREGESEIHLSGTAVPDHLKGDVRKILSIPSTASINDVAEEVECAIKDGRIVLNTAGVENDIRCLDLSESNSKASKVAGDDNASVA